MRAIFALALGLFAATPPFAAVQEKVVALRRLGSAALDLAFIAAGRFDAYWERDLSPWDMAAGVLLVREAGGAFSSLDGSPGPHGGSAVATNGLLHEAVLNRLNGA